MDRRTFLRTSAVLGAASLGPLSWIDARAAHARADPVPFEFGLASGDPLPDRVVIWTRVTPPDANGAHGAGTPVTVRWEVATDEAFSTIVRSGSVVAEAASDHTVKVDVTQLRAGTHHWFRFIALDVTSSIARTTTAPSPSTPVDDVRFGVVSCANWEAGYFGAYRGLLEQADRPGFDLDFILHVGDYLYEYENGRYGPGVGPPPRLHDPAVEMTVLDDYRRRHAQYKTDPHLRALHQRWPFVTTWDDHEFTDNTWWDGAENHDASEGDWQTRRRAAIQAYFEWMPLRDQPATASTREVRRMFRGFTFGDLVELFVLDLRQYRDEQATDVVEGFLSIDVAVIADPARTITGPEQRQWLIDGLTAAQAPWRLVANPVMITPLRVANAPVLPAGLAGVFSEAFGVRPESGLPVNADDWSGYPYDQQAVLEAIAGTQSGTPIKNVVFLTGDIHTSWACDVPLDQALYPVSPSVAAEFVCPSVTSQNIDEIATKRGYPTEGIEPAQPGVVAAVQTSNPQVKYLEPSGHGFCVVDVTAARVQQDWYFIEDRIDPDTAWAFEASWEVRDQTCAVREVGTALGTRATAPPAPAPAVGASPTTTSPTTAGATASPSTLPATGGAGDLVVPGALVAGAAAVEIVRRRLGTPALDDDDTAGARP